MHKTAYDANFYSARSGGSIASAREILPVVKRYIDQASIVDVGCGTGTCNPLSRRHKPRERTMACVLGGFVFAAGLSSF
jgi:trans-aconitate methyltransferase